jgi:hypothetical protein
MDKYEWLHVIALTPWFSPAAIAIDAPTLSWLLQELFSRHVLTDQESDR